MDEHPTRSAPVTPDRVALDSRSGPPPQESNNVARPQEDAWTGPVAADRSHPTTLLSHQSQKPALPSVGPYALLLSARTSHATVVAPTGVEGQPSGRRSGRPPGRWDRRPHGETLNPSGERPGRGRLRGPGRSIGGQHVRARTDGPSRPSTLTGRDTRAFGWLRAAKRGRALPGRSPTVEEIILVMRQAGPGPYADRTRALIAILWRAGLRISEALALTESDLDRGPGQCWFASARAASDGWSAWTIGGGSTSLVGPSTGWSCRSVRCSASWPGQPAAADGRRPPPTASCAGSRPRQGRAAGSRRTNSDMRTQSRWRTEGIPLPINQRLLGHAHLGITSIHLQGIDTRKIVDTIHHRRPPVISATAGIRP